MGTKPKRSVDSLIAKYHPRTTLGALGPRCPFVALGPEVNALARGLRERTVAYGEIARIIVEEFPPTQIGMDTVARHLRGHCRCARG